MSDKTKRLTVVLSGGDTGGHLCLAAALIQHMRKQSSADALAFVGSPGRLPMRTVLHPDVRTHSLNVMPFDRTSLMRNLKVFFFIVRGIRQSMRILDAEAPGAVIGLGGYPSGPFLYAATLKKIPTLILEPNIIPGLANRLLAKRVDRICVAFEETAACFPQGTVVVTGTPVREAIASGRPDKKSARMQLGLRPDMPTCLVIGGSLGSGRLNDTLLQNVGALTGKGIQILWQTGHEHFDGIRAALEPGRSDTFSIAAFIKNMAQAYAAADLVVSASGAVTIAELAISGLPAIIIPSTTVTDNHQHYNAQALARENACMIIEEHAIAAELPGAIINVLGSAERLHRMHESIKHFARPQAAERVMDELLKLCRRPNRSGNG